MTLCSNGNICDSADGICKCGGLICPADQLCDNTSHLCVGPPACQGVICGSGSSCDPADGKCKCNGVLCGAGNMCLAADAGGCQPDPCYGVHCPASDEGVQCIQGICRCGASLGNVTVNDPVCSRIQHCSSGMCVAVLGCDAVPPCYGYNVCDPLDLQCHCGSRLPTAPICKPGEICQSYGGPGDPSWYGDAGPDAGQFFACRGVNDCDTVLCTDGQICDPNLNFNCVCETMTGVGGPSCQQNEYCFGPDPTMPPACTAKCNPYVQQECQGASVGTDAGPLNCYAEFSDGGMFGPAVCESPNPNTTGSPGDSCGTNTDCSAGLGCWKHQTFVNGDAGPIVSTCARYCDTGVGTDGGTNDCVPPQFCTPIGLAEATGQLVQIGFCGQ
jgi:hypothetical protein